MPLNKEARRTEDDDDDNNNKLINNEWKVLVDNHQVKYKLHFLTSILFWANSIICSMLE